MPGNFCWENLTIDFPERKQAQLGGVNVEPSVKSSQFLFKLSQNN